MSSSNSASRKTDLNSQSWYAAEDLPEVYVPTDIKALRKGRSECNVTKPQMFADFFAQFQVEDANGGTGLEVVLRKWLETSVSFSGYDAIRQNVIALMSIYIYRLHDERLWNIQTKGDLIVQNSSRIKTRAQSKKEPDQFSITPVS
ncbi:hypothetical protein HO173_006203 [Letharia columbiana]|uniref:Uncharacterized protein n=1 Tax=Letharia columbiana TaxID=112416 RepID=A0A8H6L4Q5_9LECA|nr:uncharacterized protein HO173_006203 [Letharia columbiana]KAF6235520.1 hypothetical protein HO173_006203 [Letharia columbiana]